MPHMPGECCEGEVQRGDVERADVERCHRRMACRVLRV